MRRALRLEVDADLMAARAARHHVTQHLHLPPDHAATVEVIIGELLTNAVLHGAPPVHVAVSSDDQRVRIEVSDTNPHMGLPRPDSRGLRVVHALATNCGTARDDATGKTVWAEIAVNADASGPQPLRPHLTHKTIAPALSTFPEQQRGRHTQA